MANTGPNRSHRVGEQIKRILAEIMLRDMRDARLQMTSITAVKLSSDLSVARIYVTSMEDKEKREEMLEALNDAAGFMRGRLSKQLKLRRTPTLYFVYDDSIEYGSEMETLINDVIAEDESNKS